MSAQIYIYGTDEKGAPIVTTSFPNNPADYADEASRLDGAINQAQAFLEALRPASLEGEPKIPGRLEE